MSYADEQDAQLVRAVINRRAHTGGGMSVMPHDDGDNRVNIYYRGLMVAIVHETGMEICCRKMRHKILARKLTALMRAFFRDYYALTIQKTQAFVICERQCHMSSKWIRGHTVMGLNEWKQVPGPFVWPQPSRRTVVDDVDLTRYC